jgi:glucose/arabinose dehydrogenase
VVLAALVAACAGEPAPPSSSSDGSSDGGGGGGDAADAAKSYPLAEGDPCRGIPLPADQHYAPKGMCARLVAARLSGLRQITFAPDGDLFGTSTSGTIWRFHDADGDGFFAPTEVARYASTGSNGNNAHIDAAGGFIYAGNAAGVMRFTYAPGAATGGDGEQVIEGQPSSGHGTHTVHVYDGFLYVQSGSAGNATNPMSPAYDTDRSLIKRFSIASFKPGAPLAWSTGEVVTVGLRNTNGFTRNAAGRIYGVVNGLDGQSYGGQDVHNDNPGEQIVEIAMGKQYGYPFCFTAQRVVSDGNVIAPGTQLANPGFPPPSEGWCATHSSPPTTFVQAHSAPLDIAFFDDHPAGALPERWRGGAFVALHGSWNRDTPTGYKVVWIPFDAQGHSPQPVSTATTTTFPYEVVLGGGDASGAQDGAWSWSVEPYVDEPRPAGVAVSPVDGALYIATDSGGMVYRVGVQK